MFGSTALEVAIGVVFVYLSLSLVCTAANELIASLMAWRAKNLANGIRTLLKYKDNNELLGKLYSHPLIQSLYRDPKKLPSYIPSRTFAVALMDTVAGASDRTTIAGIRDAVTKTDKVPDPAKKALLVLIDQADNSLKEAVTEVQKAETALSKVQENVETWFNDSMERVGGWYKRKTQAWTFGLALIFTVALNVDSILITKRLSSDPTLRAAVVATAEKSAQQPAVVIAQPNQTSNTQPNQASNAGAPVQDGVEARTSAAYKALLDKQDALQSLGLPLGWQDPKNRPSSLWSWDALQKIFGLLLTAGAASLGAPFWFDMLNKIITIRSAGKAPEEKQKSPKEVPTPTEAGQTPREARESREVLTDVAGKLDQLMRAIEAQKTPPGNV